MGRYSRYMAAEKKAGYPTFDISCWILSDCMFCKHVLESWCCEAFPDGIPPELWNLRE